MTTFINAAQTATLAIADRAVQYGDGVFTTMLVKYGKICLQEAHFARLKRDCALLSILGVNWELLAKKLKALAQSQQDLPQSVIKVIISRGCGGRGYSPLGCSAPTVILTQAAYPSHYLAWQQRGIELTLLKLRLGLSPLAGIKHLNRLEQVLLKKELAEIGDQEEGIVCRLDGFVVETTVANLFWLKGGVLFTPTLDLAGIKGVQREQVIKAALEIGCGVQEVLVRPDALLSADALFICNALMELVPVRKLQATTWSDFSFCQKLRMRSGA
ncbi:MAG: aminodeoxychorismate lyase [Vibrionaceae bacterium]